MVWESVWSASVVLVHHIGTLLDGLSSGTASALNSTQPLVSDALVRAGRLLRSWQPSPPLGWPGLQLPLELDEFQTSLLLVILSILAANVVLVYLAWSRYGERIVEHFTNADTSDKLRDLGLRQNLPKEYTPKF